MADDDRDYKLPTKVFLNTAAIYLPSYKKADDLGNFKAAEKMLEKYNMGLTVWPTGGGKESQNTIPDREFESAIKDTREAYKALRTRVNEWIQNKAPGYPFIVPIIFCEFDAGGLAITPHSTKVGAATPCCLISMSNESMKDKMTILHEMGHAVEYPKYDHNLTVGNLMHEADGRTFLFKTQVERFGKAFFAKTSAAE